MAKEKDRLATMDEWLARADRVALEAWEESRNVLPFDEPDRRNEVESPLWLKLGDMSPDQVRVATLRGLLEFVFAHGPHLLDAVIALYHVAFNVSPELVWHMNQTKLGRMLNQGRATFQATDKRVWEEFLSERGFFGVLAPGKKSFGARAKYSAQKQGNRCRIGGHKRVRRITALREDARVNGQAVRKAAPKQKANKQPQHHHETEH